MNEIEERARNEIHDAIQQRVNLLGPTDDEDYEAAPGDMWVLNEWVMVASWTNARDGDNRLVRMGSADLLNHHRDGLLHQGLFTTWADR